MSHSLKTLLKAATLGLSMAFIAGCASTADEGEMMAELTLAEVNAKAEEALTLASEASEAAMTADGTAKAAQFQANRNSTRITELNEKIDRMFERSMQK